MPRRQEVQLMNNNPPEHKTKIRRSLSPQMKLELKLRPKPKQTSKRLLSHNQSHRKQQIPLKNPVISLL